LAKLDRSLVAAAPLPGAVLLVCPLPLDAMLVPVDCGRPLSVRPALAIVGEHTGHGFRPDGVAAYGVGFPWSTE
jgi:hypothetical protein